MWEEGESPTRHPGLDPGSQSASTKAVAAKPRKAGTTNETETLHPPIRPFGHRVTLTTASCEGDGAANVQLKPGMTPEDARP